MTGTPIFEQEKYFDILLKIVLESPTAKQIGEYMLSKYKITKKSKVPGEKYLDIECTPQNYSMFLQNLKGLGLIETSGYGRHSSYSFNLNGFIDMYISYYLKSLSKPITTFLDKNSSDKNKIYLKLDLFINLRFIYQVEKRVLWKGGITDELIVKETKGKYKVERTYNEKRLIKFLFAYCNHLGIRTINQMFNFMKELDILCKLK